MHLQDGAWSRLSSLFTQGDIVWRFCEMPPVGTHHGVLVPHKRTPYALGKVRTTVCLILVDRAFVAHA